MQKVIVIGECTLDVIFPAADGANWPLQLSGRPAGRLFNAAAMLGAKGRHVSYVSDAARDYVGDLLVQYLERHNVDTHCIDRFSDGGITASNFLVTGTDSIVANRHFPSGERFNATWPRIDAGDIVVFGGFFAIDDRTRPQVLEIINYAAERRAIILYIPGFVPTLVPRITRVMPAILENLEIADIVLTRNDDLRTIFGENSTERCYDRNIKFYCRTMLDIDPSSHAVRMFHRQEMTSATLCGNAQSLESQSAAVAALIDIMIERNFSRPDIDGLSATTLQAITDTVAAASASATAITIS